MSLAVLGVSQVGHERFLGVIVCIFAQVLVNLPDCPDGFRSLCGLETSLVATLLVTVVEDHYGGREAFDKDRVVG